MTRKPISILIAVYNCADLTEKCLESVVPTIASGDEIIIYNNGSTDNTRALLKRWKKKSFFKVIHNTENTGFVFANNEMIAASRSENDLLLLNNDTRIPKDQQGWLDKLSERLYAHEDAGIMSCRQVDPRTDTIASCGSETLPSLMGWNRAGGTDSIGQYPDEEIVEKTNFACVLIRRDALNALEEPWLDKDVFAYTEDDRLILRMRKLGIETYYTPHVTIFHTPNSTSKENKELVLRDIHIESYKTFVEKYDQYYKDKKEISVNIKSLLIRPQGYAMAAKNIIRGLEEVDVDVNYGYLYGTKYMEQQFPGDEYVRQIQRKKQNIFAPDNIEILFQMADMADHNSSRIYRILYTMLEVDGLPDEWIAGCNNYADEVWVADSFNVQTFKDAGVTKPIRVMPLGIDKNYFHPKIKPLAIEYLNEVNFVVVGEWGLRKNIEYTIDCFKKAFTKDTPVSLWIKTHYGGGTGHPLDKIRNKLKEYHELSGPPVMAIISTNEDVNKRNYRRYFPHYMMGSFYRSFDLLVNLSNGEGADMPAKEALACGVPVMRNSFSSKDFLIDTPGVVLVDHDLEFPGKNTGCPYYNCKEEIRWGRPNEKSIIEKFQYAYENIEGLKKEAMLTSRVIRDKYDMRQTARAIKQRLLEINNSELVKFRRECIEKEKQFDFHN